MMLGRAARHARGEHGPSGASKRAARVIVCFIIHSFGVELSLHGSSRNVTFRNRHSAGWPSGTSLISAIQGWTP